MFKPALTFVLLSLGLAPLLAAPTGAAASERDKRFFERVEGSWSGPGKIVAGKYEGTKFVCDFDGSAPEDAIGMALEGTCRVGVFTQPMKASVTRGESGYRGIFLDGAEGKGLDVTGGQIEGNDVVFALHRASLSGAMRARISGDGTMDITISVHLEDDMVPVIGMTLERVDGGEVGAVARQ